MHIIGEWKIGLLLGLVALAGAGALVVSPATIAPEIGWAIIAVSAMGFVMLGWHHFAITALVGSSAKRIRQIISSDSPALALGAVQKSEPETIFVPRMDTLHVGVVTDAVDLLKMAVPPYKVIVTIATPLNSETLAYAEELVSILEETVLVPPSSPSAQLEQLRRVRELMIQLKGNDVLVYADTNWKHLPERWVEPAVRDPFVVEAQIILAFGAPQKWGETSIKVEVDNGQPRTIPYAPIFPPKQSAS